MKNSLLACVVAILVICPFVNANTPNAPNLGEIQLVAQLPSELPKRVVGLSYDGEKLWAAIYLGRGQYATLDPNTLQWKVSNDQKQHNAISEVADVFASPGAFCFVNGKLWVAGAYGQSFGSIDTSNWQIDRVFKGKQREDSASQFYSSMAYDGSHLWIAWHWFRYNIPASQTQLLLKIDPDTGKVVDEYAAPAGTRTDGLHGLTWDGSKLWHVKDNKLSAIDSSTGHITAQYTLPYLKRPSGLAWDGQALWISEFDGKIWRLPF